ncbi:MAG: PEGA domain-containing protein [Deltaproteobacteria bacterium]|nr:PEGA domain-containing protein [Deltaproteobacteria bacterium]
MCDHPRLIAAIALWACVAMAFGFAEAGPKDKQQAQKHFQAGTELMKVEDFKGALAEFEKSVALYPTKNGLFNLGNCLKALHRYGDALETFERLEREFGKKLNAEMRAALERHIDDLRAVIARIEIRVDRAGATVRLDGEELGKSPLGDSVVVGPGEHSLEVSLGGYESMEREVTIVSGDHRVETFKLERATARLSVTTNVAGAMVVVDGEERGETPLGKPISVAEGEHFVRVVRDGYQDADRAIVVEPGEKLTLDFSLVSVSKGKIEPVDDGGEEPIAKDESKVSPLFWVGFSATLACGLTAGGMWLAANNEYDEFKKNGDEYEDLQSLPPEAYNSEAVQNKYVALKDQAETVESRGNMAIGFGIAAGALAVVSTIILAVDLAGDDEEPSDVAITPTPSGLAVSF